MEKQKQNLRVNIGYFLNQANGFFREFHVEFPEIFIEPDLNVLDLKVDYRFTRNHEGLLLQGDLSGKIEAQCTRCLDVMMVRVQTQFEELYMFANRTQEDYDLLVPEDGYIDLAEPFRDYLLLEIPINHVCSPDCKGVCVECGQNLNKGTCEHSSSQMGC